MNKASSQKDAVLFLGQLNDELVNAANKENALLINIKIYKPFQLQHLLNIIPSSVQTISIVQQSTTPIVTFAPLLLDFSQNIPNIKL